MVNGFDDGEFFPGYLPFFVQIGYGSFFPLIRGKHSFKAIAKIRDTTQLFLDVYSDATQVYVRPLKVWNRYSETMFLPHSYDKGNGEFRPLLDGICMSQFYNLMNTRQLSGSDQNADSWDRFFSFTEQMYRQGMDVSDACSQMCNIMMTRDERMRRLIKANFTPEDYFRIRSRMVGTGMIGGKACGMLLARKLIQNNRPDLYARLEPHDSFYIGSDVFYSYIVYNDFWDIRIRQRKKEEYFSLADTFAECLRTGKFSDTEKEQFCRLLDYYGQDPIIVRSSSILEDGFGNAFAGKYDSVFCANTGTYEERLHEFEEAVRTVYASTMSTSALDYRLRRGLENRDEQMALLVQRISGSHYSDFFMPCAAGVGYSYSPYRYSQTIDPNAGMLRLVMGLGTGAVDRVQGSYPRIINLDNPLMTTAATSEEKHRFSQHRVDVIDLTSGSMEGKDLTWMEKRIPFYLKNMLLEHDFDAETMFRNRGQQREIFFISCNGLVKNTELMSDMRDIMSTIQEQYQYPVDIEYTINLSETGEYVINLLQCRPLQVAYDKEAVEIPSDLEKDTVFLECRHASMGLSGAVKLDYIVLVDAVAYYDMPYKEKHNVARAIGAINWHFRNSGKCLMLLVPGRIGTSSPELGVPTTFSDISGFDVICEMSESRAGYMPELSYGSHIFQDLVEAGITYAAIFENEKTLIFEPEKIKQMENHLADFYPEGEGIMDVIGIYSVSERESYVYHDMKDEHIICVI